MRTRTTRRGVLATAVAAGAGIGVGALGAGPAVAAAARRGAGQDGGTPAAPEPSEVVGQAETPSWIFTVLTYQDPYGGEVSRPEQPEPGTRYVAAEVEIDNASDQPLEFASSDVRLRDEQGVEYAANSAVIGAEPRLTGQNLPGGERARGTVWFVLPEGARVTEVRLVAPPPQLRVRVPTSNG